MVTKHMRPRAVHARGKQRKRERERETNKGRRERKKKNNGRMESRESCRVPHSNNSVPR